MTNISPTRAKKSKRAGWRKPAVFLIVVAACCYAFLMIFSPRHAAYNFFSAVKQNVDPEELRAWAAKRSATGGRIDAANELPLSLRNLDGAHAFKDGWIIPATNNEPWRLTLLYGGGFFHYGIEIGPTNFINQSDPEFTIIKWVPGIYFKHEGR